MRRTLFLALMVLSAASASAQLDALLERADAAYKSDDFREALQTLEQALEESSTDAERADVYWRLARAELAVGDRLTDREAPDGEILSHYEQGESYGEQAISADPSEHLSYYWKASNVGKWGQTRGVLNSLFRAGEMRDLLFEAVRREAEHPDSYYVLGQLYAKVPGLISFGNTEYAVSLARKSIVLHEEQMRSGREVEPEYDFYIQLASHLKDRGWNERKRAREHERLRREYREASGTIEKSFRFEGRVELSRRSDEEEARALLTDTIRQLQALADPDAAERRQLERARTLLEEL